ncbi:phenylacetate-CoA ligase [Caldanaerobius fijiensis DSM 17918]|uniref:Phenylacetate-coenzyme A ligase n=1 Tax=Caldanaerobius fijiensis DSM 17918 TaxID=1121256 RepID=A0A1M4T9U8_9THEO|nr:phenylacetate--CoA ligase [Caldanaerobius fijiensis]SHE41128.1 phenylacetate-CoA ligase [Caldanaerobius fijiensis DSM 17918]
MIWSDNEKLSRSEIEYLQSERLRHLVNYVFERVPFYRRKFEEAGIKPSDIKSTKDIVKLPFTTKDDLRNNYPYGLFAVPMKEVVRIHASSGTTGRPTVVGYTRNDLNTWAELVARIATEAGVSDEDVAQIAFAYGLFTGAFGLHYGLERVGATVVPISSGNTERQINLMRDFGSTVLVSTPSYALYMAEVAEGMGVNPQELSLRLGLFGAEGSTEEMRAELEKRWGILATENYGLSEVMGPGVSGECIYKDGMHIAEDHFIVEVIDPESGEPLPYGQEGELVITPLTKEALPILRYRTRDITSINPEPCRCGRTLARMSKVKGRTDDMLIIRGVNVFPSQIEEVLLNIPEIGPHYQIIVRKNGYMDELEIDVEVLDSSLLERYAELERLREKIRHKLKVALLIDARVNLVEPRSLKRFEGKAKRVIDLRGDSR